MSGSNSRPALDSAVAYLERLVSDGVRRGDQRLPPVRKIALATGVSVPIICKALARVREKCRLQVSPGRGIRLHAAPAGPIAHSQEDRRTGRTEAVAGRLRRDIAEGRFRTRPELPSCKELSELYGVCFATLKRLLRALEDEGVLVRHKKKYRIRQFSARRAGSQILLVLSQGLYELIEMQGTLRTWVYPLINAMENECSRRNLRFVLKGFSDDLASFEKMPDLLGSAVWLAPDYPEAARQIALARALLSHKRPVFLFDGDQQHVYRGALESRDLFFWGDLGFASGYEVGRFLISRGHRNICYFAHSPDMQWSEDHLQGLRSAFGAAGYADAITPLYSRASQSAPAEPPLGPLSKNTESQLRYLERQRRLLEAKFGPSPRRESIMIEMREWQGEIAGVWRRFDVNCEKALAIEGVTAWVAAEDWIATKALMPFLARRHMMVPRDISLIGFNNTLESLSCGLTTYEFNAVAAGMAAIDLFVFPENRRPHVDKSNNIFHIMGYIVDRGSVGTGHAGN